MNKETLDKANQYNNRIQAFVYFKEDLKNYMNDGVIELTPIEQRVYNFPGQKLWHKLLRGFSVYFPSPDDAPSILPKKKDMSDSDSEMLYEDLCSLADKWIDIYQKRLEEL